MATLAIRGAVGRVGAGHASAPSADGHLLTISNAMRPPSGKPPGAIVASTFNAIGDLLVTLDEHGQLVAFHLKKDRYAVLSRSGARVVSIAFSTLRHSELFVALADGAMECIDVDSKAVVGSMKGHVHAVRTLACHPKQALLLSCATDAAILWNTSDFCRVRVLPTGGQPHAPLQHALFLPSGDGLLTCAERTLTLWRLSSFEAAATFCLPPAHGGTLKLRTCAVTPDSALAVGAGEGGWLAVWSLRTGSLVRMVLLPEALSCISHLAPLPSQSPPPPLPPPRTAPPTARARCVYAWP